MKAVKQHLHPYFPRQQKHSTHSLSHQIIVNRFIRAGWATGICFTCSPYRFGVPYRQKCQNKTSISSLPCTWSYLSVQKKLFWHLSSHERKQRPHNPSILRHHPLGLKPDHRLQQVLPWNQVPETDTKSEPLSGYLMLASLTNSVGA